MPKANNNTNQTEPEVISVVGDDTSVPTVEATETTVEPILEPTAIVPNVVREINEAALPGGIDAAAPQVLLTGGKNAKRVEVVCDGILGHRGLKKGDITDDEEYVALLKKERGRKLVREVK